MLLVSEGLRDGQKQSSWGCVSTGVRGILCALLESGKHERAGRGGE